MTRARERAYEQAEGRKPVADLYTVMVVGLCGLIYAPWILTAVGWLIRHV